MDAFIHINQLQITSKMEDNDSITLKYYYEIYLFSYSLFSLQSNSKRKYCANN